MRLNIIAAAITVALLTAACGNSEKEDPNAVEVNVEKGAVTPMWIPDTESATISNGIPKVEEVSADAEAAPETVGEE